MKKIIISLLFGFLVAVPVSAQGLLDDINTQNQVFAGENGAQLKDVDPRILVAQILKVLLSVTGTTLVAWTVYGGFLIFTSAGNSEQVEKAKSVITNGVIGLMMVLMSYSIAGFVYSLWFKAVNENPFGDYFNFWITEDTDFHNKDPLQQNTSHLN